MWPHKLFIWLLMLLTGFAASAQESPFFINESRRFFGGVVAGVNCTQVDGDTYSGYHKAGLSAGGMVYWRFSQPIGLSVSFLYSQKGSRGVTETSDPYAGPYFQKYKIDLNYVEVPLIFNYHFLDRYLLGFGGSFSALLNSRESLSSYHSVQIDASKYPFNKYTFDLIGSVSMVVWKGILLSARYQYGITPLRNWENATPLIPGQGRRDQFNNMFSFRVAYLF